jgi:hypothetical protein
VRWRSTARQHRKWPCIFRSSESLPVGTEIRSVAELLERLLTDARNTIDSFADAT